MTDRERRIQIEKLIKDYTVKNTATKQLARETLIKEGIYTKTGQLRPEFGGPSKKIKVPA